MSGYRLRVQGRFEAAHHLTTYQGGAEPSHGHSFRVEVELATRELDADGLAYDFVVVRRALGTLLAPLDHQDLNTVPPFDRLSPTTERLAAWIHGQLRGALPGAPLTAVTVWEGPDCAATYVAEEST